MWVKTRDGGLANLSRADGIWAEPAYDGFNIVAGFCGPDDVTRLTWVATEEEVTEYLDKLCTSLNLSATGRVVTR